MDFKIRHPIQVKSITACDTCSSRPVPGTRSLLSPPAHPDLEQLQIADEGWFVAACGDVRVRHSLQAEYLFFYIPTIIILGLCIPAEAHDGSSC